MGRIFPLSEAEKARILKARVQDGLEIKTIARRFSRSPNTVRKIVEAAQVRT